MGIICTIFGHKFKIISTEKSKNIKGMYAKQEYDHVRHYECLRCRKLIIQEEILD